jgi:hypothetical protein
MPLAGPASTTPLLDTFVLLRLVVVLLVTPLKSFLFFFLSAPKIQCSAMGDDEIGLPNWLGQGNAAERNRRALLAAKAALLAGDVTKLSEVLAASEPVMQQIDLTKFTLDEETKVQQRR